MATDARVVLQRSGRMLRIYQRSDGSFYYNNNGRQPLKRNQYITYDDDPNTECSAACLIDGASSSSGSDDEDAYAQRLQWQRAAEQQRQREIALQWQREAEARRQREAEEQRQREAEARAEQQRQREIALQRQRQADERRQRNTLADKVEAFPDGKVPGGLDGLPHSVQVAALRQALDEARTAFLGRCQLLKDELRENGWAVPDLSGDQEPVTLQKGLEAAVERMREHKELQRKKAEREDLVAKITSFPGCDAPGGLDGLPHSDQVAALRRALYEAETAFEAQCTRLADELQSNGWAVPTEANDCSYPFSRLSALEAAVERMREHKKKLQREAAEREDFVAKIETYPDGEVPGGLDGLPHSDQVAALRRALDEAETAFSDHCQLLTGELNENGWAMPDLTGCQGPAAKLAALEAAVEQLRAHKKKLQREAAERKALTDEIEAFPDGKVPGGLDGLPHSDQVAALRRALDEADTAFAAKRKRLTDELAAGDWSAPDLTDGQPPTVELETLEAAVERMHAYKKKLQREAAERKALTDKIETYPDGEVPGGLDGLPHNDQVAALREALAEARSAFREQCARLEGQLEARSCPAPELPADAAPAVRLASLEAAVERQRGEAERKVILDKIEAYPGGVVPGGLGNLSHNDQVAALREALAEARSAFREKCARLEGQLEARGCPVPELPANAAPAARLASLEAAVERQRKKAEESPPQLDEAKELERKDEAEEQWRIDPDDLEVNWDGELGRGAFGAVYSGAYHGGNVAVKVPHPVVSRSLSGAEFAAEVGVHARLRHVHVCQLYGISEKEGRLAMVMELCEGGNLRHILERDDGEWIKAVDMGTRARLALEIASGMSYLHARGVVHFDLKPANVLLACGEPDGSGSFGPKVSDFGLSKPVLGAAYNCSTSVRGGTQFYMAPETLRHGRAGKAADVYAFGLILFALLTGEEHVDQLSGKKVKKFDTLVGTDCWRPEIADGVPPRLARLVEQCWQHEPSDRPPFRHVVDELRAVLGAPDAPGWPHSWADNVVDNVKDDADSGAGDSTREDLHSGSSVASSSTDGAGSQSSQGTSSGGSAKTGTPTSRNNSSASDTEVDMASHEHSGGGSGGDPQEPALARSSGPGGPGGPRAHPALPLSSQQLGNVRGTLRPVPEKERGSRRMPPRSPGLLDPELVKAMRRRRSALESTKSTVSGSDSAHGTDW